jgi:hypothetical protein
MFGVLLELLVNTQNNLKNNLKISTHISNFSLEIYIFAKLHSYQEQTIIISKETKTQSLIFHIKYP